MTTRLAFDLETNGFLEDTTTIHCLCIINIDTDIIYNCSDREGYTPIEEGLDILLSADVVYAHNLIKFDKQVIHKLYPLRNYQGTERDTLVWSRLIYPYMEELDFKIQKDNRNFPRRLYGSHSLEAWGIRLKASKGDFGKTTDWKNWSRQMQEYCMQDTRILVKLIKLLESKRFSEESIQLEHDFQEIIYEQEVNGVPFDVEAATAFREDLEQRKEHTKKKILTIIPTVTKMQLFIPKKDNKPKGYKKGIPFIKKTVTPFNPNSKQQVANYFIDKYKWKPYKLTPTGKPQVDEEVLSEMKYEEAPLFLEYSDIQKQLSKLSGSKKSLMENVKDGKIYGWVITNGTVTGRCSHNIISNIPKGGDFRKLFVSPEGWDFVGCDAAGLELRCLAHYLYRYDGGAYVRTVLESDIHTRNMEAAGLQDRDQAKTFIYALIYGAGDEKLGSITRPGSNPRTKKNEGRRLRNKFYSNITGIKALIDDVKSASTRGYITGLDGRRLHVRSSHSSLNVLLQSTGAILMKRADIIIWEILRETGLAEKCKQMIHYHDEINMIAKEDYSGTIGGTIKQGIIEAGTRSNFCIPLDGQYKIGRSWYDVH